MKLIAKDISIINNPVVNHTDTRISALSDNNYARMRNYEH